MTLGNNPFVCRGRKVCWAPLLSTPTFPHSVSSARPNFNSIREQTANTSSRALARHSSPSAMMRRHLPGFVVGHLQTHASRTPPKNGFSPRYSKKEFPSSERCNPPRPPLPAARPSARSNRSAAGQGSTCRASRRHFSPPLWSRGPRPTTGLRLRTPPEAPHGVRTACQNGSAQNTVTAQQYLNLEGNPRCEQTSLCHRLPFLCSYCSWDPLRRRHCFVTTIHRPTMGSRLHPRPQPHA